MFNTGVLKGWREAGRRDIVSKADLDSPEGYSLPYSLLGSVMLSSKNWGLSKVAVAQSLAGHWSAGRRW